MNNASSNMQNAQQPLIQPTITRVAVAGARGYSGLELLKILSRSAQHPTHPSEHQHQYEIVATLQSQNNLSNEHLLPGFVSGEFKCPPVLNESEIIQLKPEIIFLATPAEISMKLAPRFLQAGIHVIDLSGAFRLKNQSSYTQWYKHEHTAFEYCASATYGLSPWIEISKISKNPQLIANPGCYATSVLMALLPLIKKNLIDTQSIIVDAKSGTTGAGKKAAENLLFSEVAESILPYRVADHQHIPEMISTVQALTGVEIDMVFTPHLLAIQRGILSSLYLKSHSNGSDESITQSIHEAYQATYGEYPLVSAGRSNASLMNLKNVVHTPRTQIAFEVKNKKIYVFSMIDNLLKGAASQAVENSNRLLGLKPETHLYLRSK